MIEGFYEELGNTSGMMYCKFDFSDYGGPSFRAYQLLFRRMDDSENF